MERKFLIKWINRWSGESGYVSKVMVSKKHFINTFDASRAKKYRTKDDAKSEISLLNTMGEGINNEFVINEA